MRRLLVAVATALAAVATSACSGGGEVRTVEMTMRHSKFTPAAIEVEPGTTVRFLVRNADPIDHELIVGPDEVQERHERGSEAEHGAVEGEVTVHAGESASTTYRFYEAGAVPFGCHAPGHFAYGMKGHVTVTPA